MQHEPTLCGVGVREGQRKARRWWQAGGGRVAALMVLSAAGWVPLGVAAQPVQEPGGGAATTTKPVADEPGERAAGALDPDIEASYRYDPFGRRFAKAVQEGQNVKITYFFL